ncbi:MAG TPA: DUF4386 domain-containing protein [Desulfosporosinus sp.]|nr:DUF4386 domain-containing protein [Desulfosporosinus sp.]
MNTNRKTAIIVGVLFIIGTVAGILSVVFTGSILGDPDYLIKISANENQIIIGALFVLIMGLALAMVPVVMFPIFKKQNEVLALGYVVFRGALETVIYIPTVISWLFLIIVSQEYLKAGAPAASYFQTLGTLLIGVYDQIHPIGGIVFSLGALMFYFLFYQSKLIPRWLSGWGLIAAILGLGAGLAGMFGLTSSLSTIDVLALPIFLQEMVMAVWLIVKGFNSPAIASESAKA